MLAPQELLNALAGEALVDWIGVPDSTLQPLIEAFSADSRFTNLIATNECEAVSIAMGKFLATGNPAVVYLQNSGFGKTIHPITSLLTGEICRVPVLLLIGWRGAPDGPPDEPQHAKMGKVMPALLDAIGVPYEVLAGDPDAIARAVKKATQYLRTESTPFALIVRPGLFSPAHKVAPASEATLSRKELIRRTVESLPSDTLFVSTTGKTSRELFFIREDRHEGHASDFYTVGGMGCASSIALGVALELKRSNSARQVCVLDGDGAALMQLGSMATIGNSKPANLLHLVIDNECYESTGGQPTISPSVDLVGVARACGYPWARRVIARDELHGALSEAKAFRGLRFLTVKVAPGSDPKLGRPTQTPRQNVEAFLRNLGR
jgi:phosphonopyruvate decarboxylase